VIEFTVQIRVPGYLDAEDKISNLLQGEGEERDLEFYIHNAVRAWGTVWIPQLAPSDVKVKIEQK